MHELFPDYWWTLQNEQDALAQNWYVYRQHILVIRMWVQCFVCCAGVVVASQLEAVPDLLTDDAIK